MKLSISVTENDVARLDRFVAQAGLPSRSAAIQRAIRLLDLDGLEQDYAGAWDEWEAGGGAADWGATLADGLGDAPR
jgi:Arc/MetJ-type ribon-helix-helix transcriptional regulator